MPLPEEPLRGLPRAFVESVRACDAAGQGGRVLTALRAGGAAGLAALFARASAASGLTADELTARGGLSPEDRRGRRLDAFVAELRAVVFLDRLGFGAITPLRADDTRRRADIVAERDGERWAVDARCASRDLLPEASFRRGPDGKPLPWPTLHDYLVHCRRDKEPQLARTMADEGCSRSAVAVALDGLASGDLMRQEAVRAWLSCGAPPEFRFGVMPGLLAPDSPDDALVPAP